MSTGEDLEPREDPPPGMPGDRPPAAWVPSLYFVEGLPYVLVNTVSVALLKRLDVDNADIAAYTSSLYLPWVIKPLWSPFVEVLGRKRGWIVGMQAVLGLAFLVAAVALRMPFWFGGLLTGLWLAAFASATHDIAADGFYMLALPEKAQAAWVGWRSTFYRLAMMSGEGGIVALAGYFESRFEPSLAGRSSAWAGTLGLCALVFGLAATYHQFGLPSPLADRRDPLEHPRLDHELRRTAAEFGRTWVAFFRKPHILRIVLFLLLYRLAEAQLTKMIAPFLLDPLDKGGLGLGTAEVGFAKGTVGVAALVLGGILGGWVIATGGLRRWLWPMVFVMHLPDLVFVWLSWVQPTHLWVVSAAVGVEQFGYGFGFTAYMMFMMWMAQGEYKTAHYAIGTGIMALGMMVPGFFAGWIQTQLGYQGFFLWVVVSTVPGFLVAAMVDVEPEYGRRG